MTVSEQVAPLVEELRRRSPWAPEGMLKSDQEMIAYGIEGMAFEIDRLRARLRLVGIALTLLAIAGAAVMLR